LRYVSPRAAAVSNVIEELENRDVFDRVRALQPDADEGDDDA